MKKILLATFGILGVIGITAGVLITHKPVPQRNTVPKGEVQGVDTQEQSVPSNIEPTSLPGDFPTVNQVTPADDAPVQPEAEQNEKKSLENITSEFDSMMPTSKDLNGIE